MLIVFEDRPSDSPLINRVWRSHSETGGLFNSVATAHWDMVISKISGRSSVILRGPETRASAVDCPADGEWVGIRFRLGTFMPKFPTADRIDHSNVILPYATSRSFWLEGSVWEHPTFENAEVFVGRLAEKGLIVVDPLLTDEDRHFERTLPSRRTEQRRFLRATGLAQTTADQIERARRATLMLKEGRPILDVVFETGYYDQAHLTRSLKRFVGLTPTQIIRDTHQMSLLYKTDQI